MSTDEYVPEEDDVRMAYLEAHVSMVDPITRHQRAQAEREAEDAWTAFLARVKRDAAREALHALRDHLAASRGHQLIGPDGLDYYIHTHHPEETP